MQYSALMLDVDGTLIPYKYDALPSKKVHDAIKKVRKNGLHVCLVTGRAYPSSRKILDYLGIDEGYAVVDGGAFVYDVSTNETIHEQYIDEKDLERIKKVFGGLSVNFYIKTKKNNFRKSERYVPYDGKDLKDVSMIFTDEVFSLKQTHEILKKLSSPTLSALRSMHIAPNRYSFNLTHAKATKLHGIEIIKKRLKLKRKEIVGVGDGYNDFPLLMASGLKIAMGNAIDDLKSIADYVAPSVDEDGVADIIEKFILKDK